MPSPSAPRPRVVILDDEPNMGRALGKFLTLEGFEVRSFTDAPGAFAALPSFQPHVLVTDLRMPGFTGDQVLQRVRTELPTCQVILMTAYATAESALQCVRLGAYDYITKPFDSHALATIIRRAVEESGHGLGDAVGSTLMAAPPAPAPAGVPAVDRELVGESPELHALREALRRYALAGDSSVLIYGESGTGKEVVARLIHRQSPRAAARFVAVNCASIPDALMESELFGHEKGAFTGAHETKIGLIEAAQGGTLFLDEVGELPLALQAKLLRALQEREITRVGSVHTLSVDIRVLAATHRKLEAAVQAGTFRADLYYRLNVLTLKVPPLRSRRGDIPLLAEYFLAQLRTRLGRPGLRFTAGVLTELTQRDWPGNVRELRNSVERLAVLSTQDEVGEAVLRELANSDSSIVRREDVVPAATPAPTPAAPEEIEDFRLARDRFEAEYLRRVLRLCAGNVTEAARRSGMSRRHFYEKMEKFSISGDEFKEGS